VKKIRHINNFGKFILKRADNSWPIEPILIESFFRLLSVEGEDKIVLKFMGCIYSAW